MNQSIAIVGASTRAAAASAKRAGFRPIAADLFADADLRLIATTTRISPYPEGFLDWLRTIEPPAWMYTGALENHPELVDQMAWIAPLWGNPGDVLERIRSAWELAAVLRNAGLLFPETRESAVGLPPDGSWLAKTYRGASGSGVRVFEIPLPPREGLGEGSDDSSATVYQRRIPGTPAAAVFVADGGAATLLGITRQLIGEDWLGSHGFQYCGSIGPLPVEERTHAAIEQIGNTLAAEFELVGLFGVDMILNADGAWALEVNPRYTASVEIVERFTGIRAIELHAAGCAGNVVNLHADARFDGRAHGKAILFAKRDVTISEAFAKISLAEGLKLPWPTLADVSPAHSLIAAGRPILTIFAEGTNMDDVEHRLRQRAAGLERELYESV